MNGDGVDDLGVGATQILNPNNALASATWVSFMAPNGTSVGALSTVRSDQVFGQGAPAPNFLGSSVAGLRDFDEDGVLDAVFGSPGSSELADAKGLGTRRGAIRIELLHADGTIRKTMRISDSYGNLPVELQDYDRFGTALNCPGDLDGDGVPDLLVGAPGTQGSLLEASPDQGAVHLLFLRGNDFPASAVFRNGLGINDPCLESQSPPSIGTLWRATVDLSYFPNATLGGIMVYSGALDPGFVYNGEEFLVDFINGYEVFFAFGTVTSAFGIGIPDDVVLLGCEFTAQQFILQSVGPFQLCNAIDLTIGN